MKFLTASKTTGICLFLIVAGPAAAETAPQGGHQPIPRATFLGIMESEFRKMDADKDNVVTRAEVEQSQRAAASALARERSRATFAQLDRDRNGQLSPAEFANLPIRTLQPNAAPVLAQADLDKDQSITLVEYRTAKLASFDRMDSDKDGVVSVAEMKAAGIVK